MILEVLFGVITKKVWRQETKLKICPKQIETHDVILILSKKKLFFLLYYFVNSGGEKKNW